MLSQDYSNYDPVKNEQGEGINRLLVQHSPTAKTITQIVKNPSRRPSPLPHTLVFIDMTGHSKPPNQRNSNPTNNLSKPITMKKIRKPTHAPVLKRSRAPRPTKRKPTGRPTNKITILPYYRTTRKPTRKPTSKPLLHFGSRKPSRRPSTLLSRKPTKHLIVSRRPSRKVTEKATKAPVSYHILPHGIGKIDFMNCLTIFSVSIDTI